MPNNCNFSDREMMDDALSSQKFITDGYNAFANECATPALLAEFMNLLDEGASNPARRVCRDAERGWYATEPAEPKQRSTRQNRNSRG